MNNDIIFWHALRSTFDFGFEVFTKIKKIFGRPRDAWQSSSSSFEKHGFEKKVVAALAQRKRVEPGELFRQLRKQKIELISYDSKEYPKILKEIASPPPLLYYRGDISLLSRKNLLAVVGTRKATSYGKAATEKIIAGMSEAPVVIVSGMALGIDAEAHKAALKNGLKTVAVLGSGLDDAHIYPQSHMPLAREIMRCGVIISEHPPGEVAYKSNFPRRNRIISGLSRGTIVVEAKEPSGALITAYRALEQNREVFAVPGSIFSATSVGTNKIISKGARITTCADDILEELNIQSNLQPTKGSVSELLEVIAAKPLSFDEICITTKGEQQTLLTKLLELELDGKVAKKGGMYYKV